MFGDNGKISQRQLERQVVLSLLGPSFWMLSKAGAKEGIPGFLGILLGFAVTGLWCLFLIRTAKSSWWISGRSQAGRHGIVGAVMFLFLLSAGAQLLEQMGALASLYLSGGIGRTASELLILLTVLVSFWVTAEKGTDFFGNAVQKRARLAEALFPFLLTGMLLLLFLTLPGIRFDAISLSFGWNPDKGGFRKLFLETLELGISFGLLFLLHPFIEEKGSVRNSLLRGLSVLLLLTLSCSAVLLGTLGLKGVRNTKDPLLLVMSGIHFLPSFVERTDILWMTILFLALLFSLGSVLFYGERLLVLAIEPFRKKKNTGQEKKTEKDGFLWNGAGILFALLLWGFCWLNRTEQIPFWCRPLGIRRFCLAAAFLLTAGYGIRIRCGRKKKKRTHVLHVLPFLLLPLVLSGCGAVEPEKRAYPLTLAFDFCEGEYEVTWELADLPELTGQDKSGEGTEKGEASGGEKNTFRGEKLSEIREQYENRGEFLPDTGHVQAILFADRLVKDEKKMEEVLQELDRDRILGRGAYVFSAEEPGKILEENRNSGDSVGEYLKGIYENRKEKTKTPVTLADVYYEWKNYGCLPDLPQIEMWEGRPCIAEW